MRTFAVWLFLLSLTSCQLNNAGVPTGDVGDDGGFVGEDGASIDGASDCANVDVSCVPTSGCLCEDGKAVQHRNCVDHAGCKASYNDVVACSSTCGNGLCEQGCGERPNNCPNDCRMACIPDCAGKTCGPDGCGGTCGRCGAGDMACDAAGACQADQVRVCLGNYYPSYYYWKVWPASGCTVCWSSGMADASGAACATPSPADRVAPSSTACLTLRCQYASQRVCVGATAVGGSKMTVGLGYYCESGDKGLCVTCDGGSHTFDIGR